MNKLSKYLDTLNIGYSRLQKASRKNSTAWDKDARHFYMVLIRQVNGKTVEIDGEYSQGSGIKELPTKADFILALLKDTNSIEGCAFEDFCASFGYDEDSRLAERTYMACVGEFEDLQRMFTKQELKKLYELSQDC